MGYCYNQFGQLACDKCGWCGGVRKRKCPHKVNGVPYCPAPALCDACFASLGGSKAIHRDCKAAAAARQAEEDERHRQRQAGRLERGAAWGDWHESVPTGMVGVLFEGLHTTVAKLLPKEGYNAHQWLDEYATTQPWPNNPVEKRG